MRKTALAGVFLLLSGCASMVVDKQQALTISTMPPQAICTASNDKGTWSVAAAPAELAVLRSIQPLIVSCRKPGYRDTVMTIRPVINPAASFAGGGMIGLAIDNSSGASADYPSLITVILPPLT